MRGAIKYIVVAAALPAALAAAERRSWDRIRYAGGTVALTTSRYDWNATLTVTANPNSITLTIAPEKLFASKQTIRIDPAKVLSLSEGEEAWRRVAAVQGAQLPQRKQTLFGFLDPHRWAGIVYETSDGKQGAVLLDSMQRWLFLRALSVLTGKEIEHSP
ncbi:MAG TPA: hypothetical protein VGF59_14845 [Bryobacteraceae bacterium]